ncbi:hypothetical protein FOL47_007823 [Perkinsus chesapeaki]|uniref:Uncharacterized protein n=1 Tax=Perkinsus chesapeaki TaxID=330153 RepID=A0A7J6LI28_PERCH|nr:hypothetical protein FOL47_007823 [Perkinsus chesapeaki]
MVFMSGCSSNGSSNTADPTTANGGDHFMAPTTAFDPDNRHGADATTPYTGSGYCSGKPAGEYCGEINGEMARILIEEHVFYFDYEPKVDLKNIPFHLEDCKEFEPDYSSEEVARVAQEFGLTTDQLQQVLTITYDLPSDSFNLDWNSKVSVTMTHDFCESDHPVAPTTFETHNRYEPDTTTPYKGGDGESCYGKPAGEYCSEINGEMAWILIEGHVFYFHYEPKVNLKNIPFHLKDCKEFEPDYSSEEVARVAQEFGLTTDQLQQVLTITYNLPSDSFHLDWKPNVSVTMAHDGCRGY